MRTALFLPLVCLSLQASEPWADAQATFRKELQPGALGCLVYVERLDAGSLRLRVLSQGMRFGLVEGEVLGHPSYGFKARALRGTSEIRLVTEVPEGATVIRLRIQGDDFSPEVLVRLPKAGETAGVILQSEVGPPSGPASKSK